MPSSTRLALICAGVSLAGAAISVGPLVVRAARAGGAMVSRAHPLPLPEATTRVVCLGDSITDYGYPEELARLLGPRYRVANEGVAGETTGQMLGRWRMGLAPTRPDVLVVLGGVNDLRIGSGFASPAVANLDSIYTEAEALGAQVVAVTVLPYEGAGGWTPQAEQERLQLNAAILARCARDRSLVCVDAAAAMADGAALARELAAEDRLHLSPRGRQRIAGLVAEALCGRAK